MPFVTIRLHRKVVCLTCLGPEIEFDYLDSLERL